MLYKIAADVLKKASEGDGTLQNLVLSSDYKNKKLLMAVVLQTTRYQAVLEEILTNTKLCGRNQALKDHWLAAVLVYDLLMGKGLHGAGKLKGILEKYSTHLKSELTRLKVRAGVTETSDLVKQKKSTDKLPRYVRVNTLKTTVKEVIDHFRREDYRQALTPKSDYDSFLSAVHKLKDKQFIQDVHIPELLIFAAGTDLHSHVLYSTGDIIFQDKASCLPAHVLAPPPGSVMMDCCAAPGNKTSHAAAIMQNKGKIFAIDMDGHRLSTMNSLTLKAGAVCAELMHADFLSLNPKDPRFSQVEYAIVDPSCSGSGIVGRLDVATGQKKEEIRDPSRLQKLSNLQTHMVKHALCFPSIKRLVYSTCSIHREENEGVVGRVLEDFGEYVSLVPALPQLTSRGQPVFDGSDSCLRLSPRKDHTNGFFVACFERKPGTTIDEELIRSVKGSYVKPSEEPHRQPSVKKIKRKSQNDENSNVSSFQGSKKFKAKEPHETKHLSRKAPSGGDNMPKAASPQKQKESPVSEQKVKKPKENKPAQGGVVSQPSQSKNKKNKKGKRKCISVTRQ